MHAVFCIIFGVLASLVALSVWSNGCTLAEAITLSVIGWTVVMLMYGIMGWAEGHNFQSDRVTLLLLTALLVWMFVLLQFFNVIDKRTCTRWRLAHWVYSP